MAVHYHIHLYCDCGVEIDDAEIGPLSDLPGSEALHLAFCDSCSKIVTTERDGTEARCDHCDHVLIVYTELDLDPEHIEKVYCPSCRNTSLSVEILSNTA